MASVASRASMASGSTSGTVERQPMEAPLNDKALTALASLRNYATDTKMRDHLRSSANFLAETVHPISEAKTERKDKHKRHIAKLRDQGEEMDAEEDQAFKDFDTRVDSVIEKMDHAIRRIVDDRTWYETLNDTLTHVGTQPNTTSPTGGTQSTTQRSVIPTQDATPRQRNPDSSDDDEDNEQDTNDDDTANAPPQPPPYDQTPTARLHAALTTHHTTQTSLTLTDRYAHDNDYRGFYTSRHDGLYTTSDPKPPVPPPALWFGREEGHEASTSYLPADDNDNDEDTTLQVVGERTSIRCPITLQPFTDPVTSEVCNHSYERSAILDMLKTSDSYIPFTDAQNAELDALGPAPTGSRRGGGGSSARARRERELKVPRVKCPECVAWVCEKELRANPVLGRMVRRVLEREARERAEDEEEEEDDDEDEESADDEDGEGPRRGRRVKGTQRRPFGVGSSPVGTGRSAEYTNTTTTTKRERMSGVQKGKRREVVEMGGDEEVVS